MSNTQYLVFIEQGPMSFEAYARALPGCIAVGKSREEAATLIHEAIELHIEDLKSQGHQVPAPHSTSELVSVDA